MRLDKFLTMHGLGTRSEVKKLISKGKITIDGSVVKDAGIEAKGDICCGGENLCELKKNYYILMHKPAGFVCSKDEPGKKLVYELLNEPYLKDINCVGRLDEDTEGLLLLTDDGKLNHYLMSPGKHVEKEYYVELDKELGDHVETAFAAGIDIGDEKPCKSATLKRLKQANCCHVVLTEGRYHQIKRMFASLGYTVTYLKRIRIGEVVLTDIKLGEYRECNEAELEKLWKKV